MEKHPAFTFHHQLTTRAVENTELHVFENRNSELCVRVGNDPPVLLGEETRRLLTFFAKGLAQDAANVKVSALRALQVIQATTSPGSSIAKSSDEVRAQTRALLAEWAPDRSLEEFTCFECTNEDGTACPYAFDLYNTAGDCLAVK